MTNPSRVSLAWTEEGPRQRIGLLTVFEPLIQDHLRRLHDGIDDLLRAHPEMPVNAELLGRALFDNVPEQLLAMVRPTMVLELNVARLEGRLDGSSPEDRFHDFGESLCDPAIALAVRREYPVLFDQVGNRLDQWVATSLEFLERLCTDWELIRDIPVHGGDHGVLIDVECGAGDRHRRGRSVFILRFSSGGRLVYKPRGLATDAHFQELLTWMNRQGVSTSFRTMRVLDRGSHGWEEFIAAERCDSPDGLHRFYERQGAYLALLYVLEATDGHCDNIIAAGEHPMLIDVEALLQSREPAFQQKPKSADRAALDYSVLRVGLLPQRVAETPEFDGVDLSGLGGAPGQLSPFALPDWENTGTDQMHLVRKRIAIPVRGNQPAADVDLTKYTDDILVGFTRAYTLLLEHREELLSLGGPLTAFANVEVRAILRPTATYSELLVESFHPDVLRRASDRDELFDRLRGPDQPLPHISRVIDAEKEDLWHGDIPIFTTQPCSRDLWTSTGLRIADFFAQPALITVRERLRQLGERDLALQRWIIQASLASAAPENSVRESRPVHLVDESQRLVSSEQLLDAARIVGDRLETLAIRANGEASWLGLLLESEDRWSVSPVALDLYDGLLGITLFLAYLGAITAENRYTDLAQAAYAGVVRRARESAPHVTLIGAFTGWGGVLYTLAHLSALWHEPGVLLAADAIVERLGAQIPHDEEFDIIGGAAGCIGSLLALHHHRPSEAIVSAAIACGDHLLARLQAMETGIGWTVRGQRVPLSGMSHGAAGIACALLKLANLTRENRFRAGALAAITYERSLFVPQAGNWRDLRPSSHVETASHEERHSCMNAWCHGAAGIGLARLGTLHELDDSAVRQEIHTALRTTLDSGFGNGHSLCHGDLGNLELFLQAGTVLGEPRWLEEVYRVAAGVVDCINRKEWRCGTPLSVETPGLMPGLAGIGYGLLRMAEPTRVPSVLTLEPPLGM